MKWEKQDHQTWVAFLGIHKIEIYRSRKFWLVIFNNRHLSELRRANIKTITAAKAEALRLIQDHLEGMVASVKKARGEHETPDKAIQARGMAQNKSVQSQDT